MSRRDDDDDALLEELRELIGRVDPVPPVVDAGFRYLPLMREPLVAALPSQGTYDPVSGLWTVGMKGDHEDDEVFSETVAESLCEAQLDAVAAADYVTFTSSSTAKSRATTRGTRMGCLAPSWCASAGSHSATGAGSSSTTL